MSAKYLITLTTLVVSSLVYAQNDATPRQLNEVTVTSRSVFRSEKGHLVVLPDRQQKKHSFTGYDLLSNLMIPGISVNRTTGEVSALSGSVSLYINGIKATSEEVRVLRPRDIIKIEFYDAPSGIFAGENAVINYIVKQPETGGYGEVTAGQKVGYLDGDYGFAGKIMAKKTAVQLFGGYGITSVAADRKSGSVNYTLEDGLLTEEYRTLDGRNKLNKTYLQADVTNSNDARVLQASLFYDLNRSPMQTTFSQTHYSGIFDSDLQRRTISTDLSHQGGGRLHGKFNLKGNQSFYITTRLAFAQNRYSYILSDIEDIVVNNSAEENRRQIDFHAGYTKSFSRGQSLSVTFHNFYKNTVSDYFSTNFTQSGLRSNEEILFGQYDWPLSQRVRLSLTPGVSALQYKQNNRKHINLFSPRMQLRLTAQLSQNQFIMFNANIGNSFPVISYISTAEQEVNGFLTKRGNPDLKNTKMYHTMAVYGLNASKFGLQVMAMYQFNHNFPVSSYYQEGSRIIQSWTSNCDFHTFQSSVSATYRPLRSLSLQLTGGYTLYEYTGYQREILHSPTLSFNANYVIADFMFSAEVKSPQKWISPDLVHVKTPWDFSLAVNYALKNWKFEVGTNNPFMKHAKYKSQSFNPIYNETYTLIARNHSQTAYIKVAYNFDFGKSVKKSELKRTENQIENALIKAK